MRQGGHSLVTAMRREDSCPFQLACVGARPGSGPAMKSPNKIFFALRLGSFPFFFTSYQGNKLLEDSALFPSYRGEFWSSFWGYPRAPLLTGPWSSLDFDGSGCERKRLSEPPGPSDFLRDQSCEVKGDGAISSGDGDGDGGPKALLSLYSVAHCGFPSRTSDQCLCVTAPHIQRWPEKPRFIICRAKIRRQFRENLW